MMMNIVLNVVIVIGQIQIIYKVKIKLKIRTQLAEFPAGPVVRTLGLALLRA